MNKATMEENQTVGEYFSNEDLFELFEFNPESHHAKTQKIIEG